MSIFVLLMGEFYRVYKKLAILLFKRLKLFICSNPRLDFLLMTDLRILISLFSSSGISITWIPRYNSLKLGSLFEKPSKFRTLIITNFIDVTEFMYEIADCNFNPPWIGFSRFFIRNVVYNFFAAKKKSVP